MAAITSKGTASIERMVDTFEALKYYRGGLMPEWARRQNDFPNVVLIRGGKLTLSELSKLVPNAVVNTSGNEYLAKLPIIVGFDATLIIDEAAKLKLSIERGSFLINVGQLYIIDSEVSGWSEELGSYSFYSGKKGEFRPFISSFGGSKTYVADSAFHSLGYQGGISYGFSIVTFTDSLVTKVENPEDTNLMEAPTGWVLNSTFEDMYFGFYCYEAKDVVVANNVYLNNIIYGIDPHDRSSGLIIANNEVHGTKEKHGIIFSREVNNSYIFGNTVYNNHRSGIMLDRSCEHNIIALNKVYDNGGDGISIYESSHNLILQNRVYKNQEHGIRVRNSLDAKIQSNVILANKGSGVYFHIRNLDDHDYRDLKIDPYSMNVSGTVTSSIIAHNGSSAIHADDFEQLKFGGLTLSNNGFSSADIGLSGELSQVQTEVVKYITENDKVVIVNRVQGE